MLIGHGSRSGCGFVSLSGRNGGEESPGMLGEGTGVGTKFTSIGLRNRLFLSDSLPEPSMRT